MTSELKWGRRFAKFFLSCVLALPVACMPSSWAFAGGQAPRSIASRQQPRRQNYRPTLDERVRSLAKNLGLNEAQQSSVKKILEQQQQEILKIRSDPSMTGRAGIDRFRALQESMVARIRAVFNEEQKEKYDPLAPRRLPSTPQQPSVEDWLKATTPR